MSKQLEQTILLTNPNKITHIPSDNSSLSIINFYDHYKNEWGAVRQYLVKTGYANYELELNDVVELYKEWKNDSEYFMLEGSKPFFAPRITTEDHDIYYMDVDGEIKRETFYKFVKASKRGNDVYRCLVNEKFRIFDSIKDITFFKEHDTDKRTSMLFVTLTYGTRKCLNPKCKKHFDNKLTRCPFCNSSLYNDVNESDAWKNIGPEFHNWMSNIKKVYGHKKCKSCDKEYSPGFKKCPACKGKDYSAVPATIEFFRVWESTNKYYPHIHIILVFRKQSFIVTGYTNKKGKHVYLIPDADKNKLSKYWHSNIDVQGLQNTQNATKDLTKYVTKFLCSEKGNKTNAMIWLFRKQSFAISKRFVGLINGCFNEIIEIKDPDETDLINTVMSNCAESDIIWRFIGILRGVHLGFNEGEWVKTLKDPPDSIKKLIAVEKVRWLEIRDSRVKKRV